MVVALVSLCHKHRAIHTAIRDNASSIYHGSVGDSVMVMVRQHQYPNASQ